MSEEDKRNQQIEDEEDDDSEDEDYKPSDDEKEDVDEEIDNEDDQSDLVKKDNEEVKTNGDKLTDEERKKRTDELWASFLEEEKPVKKDASNLNSSTINSSLSSSLNSILDNSIKKASTITKEFDFAGEKVTVEVKEDRIVDKSSSSSGSTGVSRPTFKRGLGINNLVASLGKKQKMSTLNKSKHDWELYKKDEGLEDDLRNYASKDKNSYVERQAFLQRTDLKQFEHEKSIRDKNRSRNHI